LNAAKLLFMFHESIAQKLSIQASIMPGDVVGLAPYYLTSKIFFMLFHWPNHRAIFNDLIFSSLQKHTCPNYNDALSHVTVFNAVTI